MCAWPHTQLEKDPSLWMENERTPPRQRGNAKPLHRYAKRCPSLNLRWTRRQVAKLVLGIRSLLRHAWLWRVDDESRADNRADRAEHRPRSVTANIAGATVTADHENRNGNVACWCFVGGLQHSVGRKFIDVNAVKENEVVLSRSRTVKTNTKIIK